MLSQRLEGSGRAKRARVGNAHHGNQNHGVEYRGVGMRHAPDRVVQGLAHGQGLHRPLGLGRFDRLVAACDALS